MRLLTKKMINLASIRVVTQFRIISCRGAINNATEIINSSESSELEIQTATQQREAFQSLLNQFLQEYDNIENKGRELLRDDLVDILENNPVENLEDLLNELQNESV